MSSVWYCMCMHHLSWSLYISLSYVLLLTLFWVYKDEQLDQVHIAHQW